LHTCRHSRAAVAARVAINRKIRQQAYTQPCTPAGQPRQAGWQGKGLPAYRR
jgi:hypothetical protein